MKKIVYIFLIVFIAYFIRDNYQNNEKDINNNVDKKYELSLDNQNNEQIIDNFNSIKINEEKSSVIKKIGEPDRIDKSEYNFEWYVYNSYKQNFVMVGIQDDEVVALFTNNIDSCENEDIHIDQNLDYVRKNYDTLNYRSKGNINYEINSNDEYDIIYQNNKYITVFYDNYNEDKIWGYQIIKKSCEDEVLDIHPKENQDIEESFMYQIIDLTNATRYKNNLGKLLYNEKATTSAIKHSEDMRDNNFFEHENLKNETPFDRMKKEGIFFMSAAENIAAGQTNPIFVHNGLMNSKGHRKNILGNYKYIGVGVVFGGSYKTYYTQNFFG